MLADLFSQIESPDLTRAFYLASDVDWLYRRLQSLEPLKTIVQVASNNPCALAELIKRCEHLFEKPAEPGCLSDYEGPVCCYAFALSQIADPAARMTLDYLDARSVAAHGWLNRLMARFLFGVTTTSYQTLQSDSVPHGTVIGGESTSTFVSRLEGPSLRGSWMDNVDERWLEDILLTSGR